MPKVFITNSDKIYNKDLFNDFKNVLYNIQEKLTPTLIEPEKCFEWGWFDINNLPEPLFLCIKNYLVKYKL
jgi:hypothetical protein